MIEFAEWLPDLPELNNPGATEAKNVRPYVRGYLPLNRLVTDTDAIDSVCKGGIAVRANDDTTFNIVGDASKLYSLSGGVHTNISQTSTTYSATTVGWSFTKWGNGVIAVNGNDTPQFIDIGTATPEAVDLGGSPPPAEFVAVVREFVFLGSTGAIGTEDKVRNRVRWSAIDNRDSWTPGLATQADFQDLQGSSENGGGEITGLVGGEYGIVFQERSIWKVSYEGPPTVFRFDEVLPNIGCAAKRSVVQHGDYVWFFATDGFYEIRNGEQFTPIGQNKVDQWFRDNVSSAELDRMTGAYDVINKNVFWCFPSTNSTGGNPDTLIIYDWVNKRWSYANVNAEYLVTALGQAQTMESLDTYATSGTNTMETLSESLDSELFKGGASQLAAYSSSNRRATFTGTSLPAVVETAEAQLYNEQDRRAILRGVRPLVSGNSPTLRVATRHRSRLNENLTTSGTSTQNDQTGIANFRIDARYHRVQVTTEGDFDHAIGIDLDAKQTGRK